MEEETKNRDIKIGSTQQILSINNGECSESYFRRLLESTDVFRNAPSMHDTWKRHKMNELREIDCTQRVQFFLGELLESDFLRYDWFDTGFLKKDREQAVQELNEQGFEDLTGIDGVDWKFALLSLLRSDNHTRLIIEESKAGYYISEMSDRLSKGALETFCRFVLFTRLAYEEIDRLKRAKLDRTMKMYISKMKTDIEPLRSSVRDDFREKYDKLLDDILLVGDLQEQLKIVSPRKTPQGYNVRLVCNIVGLLCHEEVYDITLAEVDRNIFTGKTHSTYLSNYRAFGNYESAFTRSDVDEIKAVIEKYRKSS